jgi:hypothetical protein
MDQTPIYALDFDGVICDSAIEKRHFVDAMEQGNKPN